MCLCNNNLLINCDCPTTITSSFNTPPPSPCSIPKDSIKPKPPTSKDLLISEYADPHSPLSTIDSCRHRPKIHHVTPNMNLLSRLNSFLPQLQQSNQQLLSSVQSEGNQRFDIEHVTPGIDNVIEMKLGLGLFQVHPATSDTELPKLRTPAPQLRPLISDLSCDYTAPGINQIDVCSPHASLNHIVDQFYNSPFGSDTDSSSLSDA